MELTRNHMLTISGDQFLLDGKPFRILSGAVHYFRVVPGYWRDRLEKARAFGLNTVETYVAWNLHEPRPGEFHFEGRLDIVRFIQTAGELGLKVIVRPGPYICSEWEFGGLPSWLLKDPSMQVRCTYPPYLEAVGRYLEALLPRLTPLQASRGGPIIAMQVENEYGSFGNDKEYLELLANGMRSRGVDALLFTSDPSHGISLQEGGLPDLLRTVNFAFGAKPALRKLRLHQPAGPLMVTEFWSGWFDHWGERHHIAAGGIPTGKLSLKNFKDILALGASFNIYMFHGGTNFGFLNGANQDHKSYRPTITSYDYAAPLDESGDLTRKFIAFQSELRTHLPDLPRYPFPRPIQKRAFGTVVLEQSVGLFEALEQLSQGHIRPAPEPMENFDQDYGFILYRTHLAGPRPKMQLGLHDLHDRAQIFLDGKPAGLLEREFSNRTLFIKVPPKGVRLDILVENMGRINFGPGLLDRKGITQSVTLGSRFVFDWEIFPLPLEKVAGLGFSQGCPKVFPAFLRGSFDVDELGDTFLSLPGWTKGVAWLNGFNLGRYWNRGPQHTLYVPAPLLRQGRNEIIILELHKIRKHTVQLVSSPSLNRLIR
jgi:beta-galactosidase